MKFFNGRVQHVTWTYPPTQNLFCLVTRSLLPFVNGTAGATARYGYRKKDDSPGLEVPQSSMLLEMAQKMINILQMEKIRFFRAGAQNKFLDIWGPFIDHLEKLVLAHLLYFPDYKTLLFSREP